MTHHFGTLRPSEKVSHNFVVSNPTDRDWTLADIAQSCTRSVAKASSQVVRARGDGTFRFDGQAPAGFANERRWVTLTCRDPSEREVRLVGTAWVRPALAPRAPALNLGNIALDRTGDLELGNFSATDRTGVAVTDAPDRSTIPRTTRIDRQWDGPAPRQTWSLGLRVATRGIKPGAYRRDLHPRSSAGDATSGRSRRR